MYRVLIVDDDHLVREGMRNSLSWLAFGFDSLFFAQNGKEALAIYEKYNPDLVITDIRMPFLDGIELCERIRKISGGTKIIIISGYSEFEYAQKAILYDVFAYLLKPLESDVIKDTLHKVRQSLDMERKRKNESLIENLREYNNVLLSSLLDYTNDLLQITSKLRKTGFLVDNTHYRMMALDYHYNCGTVIDQNIINNIIKKISEENNYYYLVKDFNYYLLMANKAAISDIEVARLYKIISGELNSLCVSAGAGSQFENIEDLKNQAKAANKTLKNKYYDGNGKIYFSKPEPQNAQSTDNRSFSIDNIIKNIKNYDKTYTTIELNLIFAYYKNKREFDINKLCIGLMQLYNKISEELSKEYPFLTPLANETVFENIYNCDSFQEVRKCFTEHIEALQQNIEEFREFNNQHKLVENIVKYIDQNYDKDLSLDELSKCFFISTSYISKLFKQECGLNIKDYIKDIRMSKASDMLINSNKRVKAIAEELGYLGYRHFCTVFKNHYKMTPLQYRIMNNNTVN